MVEYRNLGPENPSQDRTVTRNFNQNADRDLVRQDETRVKASRVEDRARDIYNTKIVDRTGKHSGQPYTAEEIMFLQSNERTHDMVKTSRVVGSPKNETDSRRLGTRDAQQNDFPKMNERIEKIKGARDSMLEARQPLGNGIIAGTKRGGSNRRFD